MLNPKLFKKIEAVFEKKNWEKKSALNTETGPWCGFPISKPGFGRTLFDRLEFPLHLELNSKNPNLKQM